MIVVAQVTKRASTSTFMVLIKFFQNIPISAPEGLNITVSDFPSEELLIEKIIVSSIFDVTIGSIETWQTTQGFKLI